ncbi:MAG TPA: hypothetical protein PLE24_01800 [Chitinispirillaceae bacterium]|nr:hypothetical protein [Chitinispirillaceae bacterium]
MINKKLFSSVVILSLAACVYSQSVLGLKYPFGLPLQSGSGPSLSLGGAGTGVSDDYFGMVDNPANLGTMNRAVFNAAFSLSLLNIYEDDKRSNHAGFGPRLLSFSFPLGMIGALGFSYNQQTDTDMKFRLARTYPLGDDKIEEDLALVRSGGMYSWQVGVGVSITKWARIGLGYQRVYFNNQTSLIKKTEGFLSDTLIDSTNTGFTGNGIRAGIQSSVQNLTLGISGQYVFKSDARDKRTIRGTRVKENSPQTDAPITENLTYELKPAPSIAFGASYIITPEWMAAMELEATLWNRFYSEIETVDEVDRAYSFSIGTQYIPAPNLLTPKYHEIMQYRAGFRYSQLPAPTASEFAFTLGIGLPLKEGGGLFDVVLEYGRRRDSRYQNFTEEFAGIYLGINAGRKWYQSAQNSY